jgi:hypothetical protein
MRHVERKAASGKRCVSWPQKNLVLSWLKSFLDQLWELVPKGPKTTWYYFNLSPF